MSAEKRRFGCVRPTECGTFQTTLVIFNVPAISGGYYLDTAATRFSFNAQVQRIGGTTKTVIVIARYLYLDRGLLSFINRFQLYDASRHLLEDIQNYHILYSLGKGWNGNKAAINGETKNFLQRML